MSQSTPATEFDPYYKWLGIPKKDQPPNHYRLLGLEVFERDAEVIDAAANRLMDYLQNVAAGPRIKESQRLLNEISAARLVLLDEKKRKSYDAELKPKIETQKAARAVRGKSAPTPPPAPPRAQNARAEAYHAEPAVGGETWDAPAEDVTVAEPLVITSGGKSGKAKTAGRGNVATHHAPKRKTPPWAYIAGGGGLLAAIVIVIVLSLGGDGDGTDSGDQAGGDGSSQVARNTNGGSGGNIAPRTSNSGGSTATNGEGSNTPANTTPGDPDTNTPNGAEDPTVDNPAGTDPPVTPGGNNPSTSIPDEPESPTPGTTPGGNDPGGNDPAPPMTDPDATTNRLDDLLAAAKEAVAKDDFLGALKHLEEYDALEPAAPMEVKDLLGALRVATSDEHAEGFMKQQAADFVKNVAEGRLAIKVNGQPESLSNAVTERLRKAGRKQLGLETPAVANNPPGTPMPPSTEPMGDMPPAQPAVDSPLAKLQPNDDPQAFLKQALTKKGTQWLLKEQEDEAIKEFQALGELNKKYLEARKPIEEILGYRKQIDAAKRQAPPGAVLPEQVRLLEARFGETAYDTQEKVKQFVQAWAAAYNDLLLAASKARGKYEQVEAYYAELAADPNVSAAVTKARSGKLGPSQPFKAKRKELDKYTETLGYVPCWRSGQDNFIHTLVNSKISIGFANRPALNINGLDIKATIQIALCEQAGIELGEAINLTFTGNGAAQQIECRKVTIPSIRIGPHELKDVPALAFPPGATFMANALGEGSFDGFEINFLPEEFRFEIEARGPPPLAE